MTRSLRERKMKSSFKLKDDVIKFIQDLKWAWRMPWRVEQREVIETFLNLEYDEIVIQAIFGGGKTTIMLAIIYMLVLNDFELIDKIFICAFNLGIKNEIKKKLRKLGKFNVKTFDSFIYKCCEDLNYTDLKLLNFAAKRIFVRENLDNLTPNKKIKFVFIDETQDLERSCYYILKQSFPNAKFLFVGDIFQSIQKEPRESMLWFLLNRNDDLVKYKIYKMMDTPRVPTIILDEMKDALVQYYPEFNETITNWYSSSNESNIEKVKWIPFKSYYSVYKKILEKLKTQDHTKTMILTFSSAITVRGALGDVARFRKILESNGILLNHNHKKMLDDRLFLTTANSSKGLERDHVICILTFPLELAFANFSNDLVMNLITVALSRCKKDVTFYVPIYSDRFSSVLNCFKFCPKPIEKIVDKNKIQPMKECNSFEYDPTDLIGMLQKEHSVTEILRQGIISFETRQLLLKYSKNIEQYELNNTINLNITTEEKSTFVGLIFESLILSLWTKKFQYSNFNEIKHHNVFSGHFEKIIKLLKNYKKFIKLNKITSESTRFNGCFLYAQLHLFAYQKIFVNMDIQEKKILYEKWKSILPFIKNIPIKNNSIKTQVNISMPFLNGIIDAAYIPNKKENSMDIYEIKASKTSDWKQTALLQAIIYGILSAKALFNVYLVNVLSKNVKLYKIYFHKDLMFIRNKIIQEILNWNINCYLSKNIIFSNKDDPSIKYINVQETLIIDGRFDELKKKWIEFSICEFTSITKTRLTILIDSEDKNIENELKEFIEKYQKIYKIKNIYACPEICKYNLIEKYNMIPIINEPWQDYKNKILSYKNNDEIKLDWDRSYNTLALIVCSLIHLYK